MDVKTIAIAILGGAFDSNELGDNDISCVPGALEALQLQHVTGSDDVQLELVERSHTELLTAERDALQQLLNARDEEIDRLRTLLRSMTCSYREAITNGHDRIVFLGGECDSPERMMSDNPSYAKAWKALERKP